MGLYELHVGPQTALFHTAPFRLTPFQVSTANSVHGGASPLINGQPNKCRLEEWPRDAVLPPASNKITKDTVDFDGCSFFEVAIH